MSSNWHNMMNGDKEAFLSIYQENFAALFHYGFSITADRELTKDCIQDLFLDIWNTRPSLNKEVINVRSYLFTWLRRKTSHKKLLILRQGKSNLQSSEANDREDFCYETLLIAFQQSEEKKEQLCKALESLTKNQMEIIRLKFYENMSYEDIAQRTSLTTRTVYNIVYEAMRRLKESMLILL